MNQEVISKWHITDEDIVKVCTATRHIENEIDRMVARRHWIASMLESRSIPFNSLALINDTPELSNAIDYQYWASKRNA